MPTNIDSAFINLQHSIQQLNHNIQADQGPAMIGLDYIDFGIRFLINIVSIFILVRIIYYNAHKNKDYLFTFILFNTIIFLICILLSTTTLKLGFAFGLFAIFSIMRYRTVTVPIKEMGYFFIAVAIGIINALTTAPDIYIILGVSNAVILLLTFLLDRTVKLTHENVKEIIYERIDLISPDKRDMMLEDLRQRTGLPIHRVEIYNINFLRDTANVHAFYYAKDNENAHIIQSDDD